MISESIFLSPIKMYYLVAMNPELSNKYRDGGMVLHACIQMDCILSRRLRPCPTHSGSLLYSYIVTMEFNLCIVGQLFILVWLPSFSQKCIESGNTTIIINII